MTIRITSKIQRSTTAPIQTWLVTTAAVDLDAEPSKRFKLGTFGTTPSFAHAVALAGTQRTDLDDELMEDVHESRSRRRAAAHA